MLGLKTLRWKNCVCVCVWEKVWEKERCMWLSDKDRTEARQGSPQTDDQKETFTLNSNRPVSGAGSGIVAGPDRVRRGLEGETGGGWGAGTQPAPGVVGGQRLRGQWGEGGEVLADFHGVQMLNMQMSNRIVRRWIGSPPDLHQDNPWQWLRGQRSSPGRNEQPAADAPENVWTWSRLYSMTRILIDLNFCLSVWERIWHLSFQWRCYFSAWNAQNIHCLGVWPELYVRAAESEATGHLRNIIIKHK